MYLFNLLVFIILGFSTAQPVDSARANLASSFVNGFVNCSFGVDKLLTEEGNKWLYKNKSFGTKNHFGIADVYLYRHAQCYCFTGAGFIMGC